MSKKNLLFLSLAIIPLAIYLHTSTLIPEAALREALSGKVILIAGASSGIGEQVAYRYARAGAALLLSARSAEKLARVKAGCEEAGAANVTVILQDFSRVEDLETYRDRVLEVHPGGIDILLLNHGAMPISPWMATARHHEPSFVERIYRINVLSQVELTRLFMPVLEARGGQIQVTGSLMGDIPFFTGGLYSSTKFALHGFFRSLQQELLIKKSPVTVSIFAFGLIWTEEMGVIITSQEEAMAGSGASMPWIAKGDVGESADIIVSATVTRPEKVDYPVTVNLFTKFLAVLPRFSWIMTVAVPFPYEQIAEVGVRMKEVSHKMGYQVGNQ